jgi:hypothetical protein
VKNSDINAAFKMKRMTNEILSRGLSASFIRECSISATVLEKRSRAHSIAQRTAISQSRNE